MGKVKIGFDVLITALSIDFLAQPFPQQGEYVKFIAYWIEFVKISNQPKAILYLDIHSSSKSET
jgi:hypothetical protein